MQSNSPATNQSQNKSHAIVIWLVVIIAVLLVLYLETMGPRELEYNVLIDIGGGEAGSNVIVDGKPQAALVDGSKKGLTGTVAWLKLANGKRRVEIERNSKILCSREFEVQGKEYLRFDLEKPKD